MPKCENCGAHVTHRYIRVLGKTGAETVPSCPHCPDEPRAHYRRQEGV